MSALASAVAAIYATKQVSIAAEQTALAAEIPFKQALFEAKIRAIDEYVKAGSQFENDVRLAVVSLPWAVNTPADLAAQSDEHMLQNSIAAQPMIERYHQYVIATDAAGSQWSQPVRNAIKTTQQTAYTNVECFIKLGQRRVVSADYWKQVRVDAAGACKAVFSRKPHSQFIANSRATEDQMRDELAKDARQKGPAIVPSHDPLLRL